MQGFIKKLVSIYALIAAVLLGISTIAQADPQLVAGKWFVAHTEPTPLENTDPIGTPGGLEQQGLNVIDSLALTGGSFRFEGHFKITEAGPYVIDFKNTSTIGLFRHTLLDSRGMVIKTMLGGIQSPEENPYPFRHARDIQLEAGEYTLLTDLSTPFLIAQPQPYLDSRANYLRSIKSSNTLTLMCLGIFIGLGLYYATLSMARSRGVESMYALFILGNLLYNGTSLLVFSDVLDMHWMYLSSFPILFSNMAYVLFVRSLLGIGPGNHPKLHKTGQGALVLLAGFALLGLSTPAWSMEMARYGVGVFLCYGLLCGTTLSLKGNTLARFYLLAILVFFALGSAAITLTQMTGKFTFYVEHLGLLAVTVEVVLLALVLTYQFHQLNKEKKNALDNLQKSQQQAMTDQLTGLPNRYALEIAISNLPPEGCLSFLDLDGLKYYNDNFGHDRGDMLLRDFSRVLQNRLGIDATLHRLGGDEFAITCTSGDQELVKAGLAEAVQHLSLHGFEFAGFSLGTVHVYENTGNLNNLMHMADTRMYENKRQRKKSSRATSGGSA